MTSTQKSISLPVPDHSRYIELTARSGHDIKPTLKALALLDLKEHLLIGFGAGLVQGLGQTVKGLHAFKSQTGPGCEVPSTQADLFCWIRGSDRGEISAAARSFISLVTPSFEVVRTIDGFKYKSGLDLTGYEDGTENPQGKDAETAAFVAGQGNGMDGSSFVSIQQWVHDMLYFDTLATPATDDIIGRRLADNSEFDEAPLSAHVKRTAQESFNPEAFVLRRSMPWSQDGKDGLVFVAFGKSFDAFDALLHRMIGGEDGVVDGLFSFSQPITGANYWCPPVVYGHLDLTAINL